MSDRLSEESIWSVVEPGSTRAATIDIGNATNNSAYVSMQNFSRCILQVELGTFNSSDELDEVRLEQADTLSGGNVKDLTTDAAGGNYDTGNKIGSDGDFVVIEVRGEDLDLDITATSGTGSLPFIFVRALVKEDNDGGQDDCFGQLIRYRGAYPQKELQGAASANNVYVDTNT